MVWLELHGAHNTELWFVGTHTMEDLERFTLLLRKCKLSYRTQRAKRGKVTLFTTYFPPLPTIFGTYRPVAVVAQSRLLSAWTAETEPTYKGKYVAISHPQVGTLQWCIDRFGAAHRTVERPVVWKGHLRPGFLVVTEW